MCLPQIIKSFQNYRGVATTFYPTLVFWQRPPLPYTDTSSVGDRLKSCNTASNLHVNGYGFTFLYISVREELTQIVQLPDTL